MGAHDVMGCTSIIALLGVMAFAPPLSVYCVLRCAVKVQCPKRAQWYSSTESYVKLWFRNSMNNASIE
eukprot:4471074-Amphidinium_carterae.1